MRQPRYHISIPAIVRYDTTLKPAAKLLYGEVLALCDQTGYCWATNQYFAILYGVNKETVSGWFSQLVAQQYVRISYEESPGYQRRIYLEKLPENPIEKSYAPLDKNAKGLTNNHQGDYENPHRKTASLLIGNNIDYNDRIHSDAHTNLSRSGMPKKKENGKPKSDLLSPERSEVSDPPVDTATPPFARHPPSRQRSHRKEPQQFIKPAVKEVEDYLLSQKECCLNTLTARTQALRFFNYYESNGWRVGRNPMQNWQAAADNWQLNAPSYATKESEPLNRLHSGGKKDYSIPL